MKRLTTALVLVASSGLVDAHHSRANFDTSQTTIITGTLTDFSWRNPHVYMEMEVTADDGTVNTWLVESHSVTGLLRMGWSRDTLQEGETITLAGSADFNPDKHFILMEYVEKADGQRLYAFRNPTPEPEEEIIQPSTDFSGTWRLDISRFNIKEAAAAHQILGAIPSWDRHKWNALAWTTTQNFSV